VASSKCPRCGTILYSAFASPGPPNCSECGALIGSDDRWHAGGPLGWSADRRGSPNGDGMAREPRLLVVTGDWDLAHLDELRRTLHGTIEEDDRRDLIVDVSQVDLLGEDLIGVLVGVLKHLRAVGQRLFVVGARDVVLRKLQMMGLDRAFGTQQTRSAAIAAAGS
jgi:anti-anti-sigma factor